MWFPLGGHHLQYLVVSTSLPATHVTLARIDLIFQDNDSLVVYTYAFMLSQKSVEATLNGTEKLARTLLIMDIV